MEQVAKAIQETPLSYILEHYEKPFNVAIHARIKFHNVRLRKGTCFEKWGIALEPTSKFKRMLEYEEERGLDARNLESENLVRSYGWYDVMSSRNKCAFGKLYEADWVILNVSELELWSFGQVYEWDDMEVLFGESTGKFRTPPDFVTMQSNKLFEMKSAAKFISKHYTEGVPYQYNLSGIPDGIAESLRDGTCTEQFFESWYTGTVKGMFNGIYGTQAQDVRKPKYTCKNGELVIDESSRVNDENYNDEDRQPGNLRVMYNYGLRIVGGSRMHMVIAMELVHDFFGHKVAVLGGDTDSMKCACAPDVTDDELEEALKPIAVASKKAIDKSMARLRKTFPKFASTLTGIGSFDIENRGHHYSDHIELWNKCRVSWDAENNRAHVTCAGLRRPAKQVNIENAIEKLIPKYGIDAVLNTLVGYNVCVMPNVSHALEHHKPKAIDTIDMDVTDWNGTTRHVTSHQSTALYPSARWLGETLKATNLSSVNYLRDMYGRDVNTHCRYIDYDGERITVTEDTEFGQKTAMWVEVN